ncbi:murein biosynthesis integral membrane protein MurJ [Luminiphilus sp. nBUS_07]|uniref:murein biosynthesis integral membrane protein MurJ n=1 Tax=Luminiphilus sp. nBUS_07 TaxID=3395314 RepID=UPI003EBC3A8F
MSLNNDMVSPKMESVHRRTESTQKAGVKNVLISIFVSVSSFFSLTVVAMYFGGTSASDAYFFLLSMSAVSIGLIGSVLGVVFLPAFVKLLSQNDEAGAHKFLSSIFSWCLVITLFTSFLLFIWNEHFFSSVSKFNSTQITQMSSVLMYFPPIFFFGVLSELFRVIALSIGQFTTAAISALFPPLFLIAFLFALRHTLHEETLVASLLLARAVSLTMLVTSVRKAGIRVKFNLTKNANTYSFLRSSAPYFSATIVTNAATFYFDYQASGLGTGAVSALAYAKRLFMLPTTVFLTPILEITRTKFAEMQAVGDHQSFNSYYNNLLRFLLYYSIPIAAVYFVFSHEIISVLFQRGAFGAEDVKKTASILAIYAWSLPIYTVFSLNGRACESYRRLFWISVFGSVGHLFVIAATYYLTNKFGLLGIPVARLFADIVYFLPFGFVAFHLFGGLPQYRKIIASFLAALVTAIPIALFFDLFLLRAYIGTPVSLGSLVIHVSGYFILYSAGLLFISSHCRKSLLKLMRSRSLHSRR